MYALFERFQVYLDAARHALVPHNHHRHRRPSPLMNLPPELIIYIAQFLPKLSRHDLKYGRKEIAASDLSAFASTCSSMRIVLIPMLFADLNIHSSNRLTTLSKAPAHILALVHNLTIQLDLDFYETWIWSLDHRSPSPSRRHRPSNGKAALQPASKQNLVRSNSNPLYALSTILLRTASTLRHFAFVMRARPTSAGSAWSQFPRPAMAGIPFATPVVAAMNELKADSPASFNFPELRSLCLDGTADIAPFLALAPNMLGLRLRIPEGFNASDCQRIIGALNHVPRLRKLEMWIWELSTTEDAEEDILRGERMRLIGNIGQSCPDLEWLGFQTRSFDYADGGMGLRVVSEKGFDWKDMVPVMHHFPALVELHLPGTLYRKDEQHAFFLGRRYAAYVQSQESSQVLSPASPAPTCRLSQLRNFMWRANVLPIPIVNPPTTSVPPPTLHYPTLLERIEAREQQTTALLLQASSGRLSKVGWVREEGSMVGVIYESQPGTMGAVEPSVHSKSEDEASREYGSYLFNSDWWDEDLRELQMDQTEDADDDRSRSSRSILARPNLAPFDIISPLSSLIFHLRAAAKRRDASHDQPSLSRPPSTSTYIAPIPHLHSLAGFFSTDSRTLTFLGAEALLYAVFMGALSVSSWSASSFVVRQLGGF